MLPMDAKNNLAIATDTQSVTDLIEAFLQQKLDQSGAMSPYYHDQWLQIQRLFRAGGKRLRSRLTVLSYQMFGGSNVTAMLPSAAATELLHLAMLMHDDIIDRDYTRYGVENIAGHYNEAYEEFVPDPKERLHYSHSAALLAGDLLLSEAYGMIAQSDVEPRTILDVQALLATSIFEVVGGELLDTEAAFRGRGSVSPETVARYKTASYTTTLPLLIGATLAGASKAQLDDVRLLGTSLGIAFQLRDDLIGVFGDEAETGKSTAGDIREGKYTYMIEQFYMLANGEQRIYFDEHFGDPTINEEGLAHIRELLRITGAIERAERAIATHEATARKALSRLTIDPAYEEQFNDLIIVVTKRNK